MAQKIIVKILFIGTLVQSPVIIMQIFMLIHILISLLQMLYELRVISLESSQHIARQAIAETIVDGIERCVLTLVSG